MSNPWEPRKTVIVPAGGGGQSTSDFFKQREIAHYRKHGKSSVVIESELAKMKEWGLYREGDELLTVDFYGGNFIVLRGGEAVRIRYGPGSAAAEREEELWMEKARGRM